MDEFEAWSVRKKKKPKKPLNLMPSSLAGGVDEIPQILGKKPLAAEDRPEEERMTREQAEALAGQIIGWLEPLTEYAEVAGSYRRGRQDPGDLDVVVILKPRIKLPEITELWISEGKASAVNWVGEKKTQMLIDGVKVDIRTTTPRALGAALLYFTGPAGYNIGIRRSAKSRGMKLNEYGIFNRETNEYLGGATEEEIYEILGKNFRPATERRAEEEEEEIITRSLGEIPDDELRMLYQQGKISKMQMQIGIGLKMDSVEYEDSGDEGEYNWENDDFEASAIYRGKKPEGAVAKALLSKKLMDEAELSATLEKLENAVRMGMISEEEVMKKLTDKFGAEYDQAFDISMACPKCDKTLYPIGEAGDRKSENLMHFEYYCDCDEKPKIVVSPDNRQQNWELSIANPCSNCGDKYEGWKQEYHPITGRINKNATQYWTMCEVCHKGFCGNGSTVANRFCQTQDSVCNDCEPFNTYGKYRAESFGAETYTPPAAAVKAAKRGLEQRKKYGRGGLSPAEAKSQGIDSGVTRARKIASGKVSKHDVRRMSAFNRHRKNNNPGKKMPDGGPTAGTIAWNLWGGTSGVNWAKKKSAAMNAESSQENEAMDYLLEEIKNTWYLYEENIKDWVEHDMAGDGLLDYWDQFNMPDGTPIDDNTTKDEYFDRKMDSFLKRFEKTAKVSSDDDYGIMIEGKRVLYVPVGKPVNLDSLGNWENRRADQYGYEEAPITSWTWSNDSYMGVVFGDDSIDHMGGEEGKDFDCITLHATMPWEAIDWASTIAFNISSHWQERELCVMDEEPVYNLDIYRNGKKEAFVDEAMNAESLGCKGYTGWGRYGQAKRCWAPVEYMGYCKDCATCQSCRYSLKQDYEDTGLSMMAHSERFCHQCWAGWEDTEEYEAETQEFADRFEIQIRTSRGNTTERIPVGRSMLVRRLREILSRQRLPYAIDVFGTEAAFNVMGPYGMQVYRPKPKLLATYKYGQFESGEMADHLNEKLGL